MCHTMGFSVGRPLFIAISWQLNDKPTNDTLEEDVGRVGGGYATQKSIPETGKCYGNTRRVLSPFVFLLFLLLAQQHVRCGAGRREPV